MSLVLIPNDTGILPKINSLATESIIKTLKDYGIESPYTKPPNDVYIRDRKIAGVLADCIIEGNKSTVYLGIGINVNNDVGAEPLISKIATSVYSEIGEKLDVDSFTVSLLTNIDLAYYKLLFVKN